jgi:hypothetical protein
MANTTIPQELGERIERLVQEYISATRIAAHAAMDRAFACKAEAKVRQRQASRSRKSGARRASSEVAELSERLYEAVCANPGKVMTVLAPLVGGSARELWRPMAVLKQAGRVRSVGTRAATRYFPIVGQGKACA